MVNRIFIWGQFVIIFERFVILLLIANSREYDICYAFIYVMNSIFIFPCLILLIIFIGFCSYWIWSNFCLSGFLFITQLVSLYSKVFYIMSCWAFQFTVKTKDPLGDFFSKWISNARRLKLLFKNCHQISCFCCSQTMFA